MKKILVISLVVLLIASLVAGTWLEADMRKMLSTPLPI